MNILELPQTHTMRRLLFLQISADTVFSQMIQLFFLTQTEQLLANQWAFNLLRIYQDRHRLVAEMPSSYPPPLGSHRLAQGNGNPCKHSQNKEHHIVKLAFYYSLSCTQHFKLKILWDQKLLGNCFGQQTLWDRCLFNNYMEYLKISQNVIAQLWK